MSSYNDGKPPTYKPHNQFVKDTGGADTDIRPGEQSKVAAKAPRPSGSTERPTARGNGLFRAKGCVG